ncbi:hypothetical protein NDU88_007514 [Pleurodeles waltl]|uniref:Prolactin receptor n=1 Tax=Pleurodeles waltl TaxID=8319 RepID=A0AAV7PLM5_PLEWA|nr:hypothetical protein NDU88_007514 [Pleurodeles waltl]
MKPGRETQTSCASDRLVSDRPSPVPTPVLRPPPNKDWQMCHEARRKEEQMSEPLTPGKGPASNKQDNKQAFRPFPSEQCPRNEIAVILTQRDLKERREVGVGGGDCCSLTES